MKKVVVYSTAYCPYCDRAKELLKSQEIPFEEIRVDEDSEKRQTMERISGRRTVPQIFIGDKHVGGYDDLIALYKSGELTNWLKD